MELEPGTQVTPVVRLVRPLGRGGMGAVWIAEHQTLRTEVVVKFMADALAYDPVSLARFSHEASAAAAVKSPHVVQMLDHGFTGDGTPFIVMELLDGEDLRKRLQRDQVVPLGELGIILTQACKALARAHAAGIIHRDIKPDNLFLCRTDDGEPFVKLLDFGVAKSSGPTEFHMTQTGVMVGTPFYMSPEQAVGAPPVEATTDLWSLGVVAFEAMTGTRPFDGNTIGALTIAICSERPPVPSAFNPKVPSHIDAWLARACAREPAKRFPTARAMGEALTAALRGEAMPKAVPLAFAETYAPDDALLSPVPGLLVPSSPRTTRSAGMETASGLATTTTSLSRTTDRPVAPPAPVAPVRKPVVPPPARGRGAYLVGAGVVVALGIGLGFVFAFAQHGTAAPPPAAEAQDEGEVSSHRRFGKPPASAVAPVAPDPARMPPESLPPPAASTASMAPPASAPIPDRPAPSGRPATVPAARVPSSPPARPAASAAPTNGAVSCDPPFYYDAAHNKVFKKECL